MDTQIVLIQLDLTGSVQNFLIIGESHNDFGSQLISSPSYLHLVGTSQSPKLNPNGGISNLVLLQLQNSNITSKWIGNIYEDTNPKITLNDQLIYLGWESDDINFNPIGFNDLFVISILPETLSLSALCSFGTPDDDFIGSIAVSNYASRESLYVGGYSMMSTLSYGSYDAFLIRLHPVTLNKIWVVHFGGAIHDYIVAGRVNVLDGSAFLFVQSNSPEWSTNQDVFVISIDFESQNQCKVLGIERLYDSFNVTTFPP